MGELAIRAIGLGKRYRVGGASPYLSLRESLASLPRRLLDKASGAAQVEELWALRNVSFEVAPGEVLGVIGRNGAGKSTLLKILSRITRPTAGRAEVWGRVGSLLEVGTGFHPELTGRENVWLYGAILGLKRHEIARRFGDIVAFSEVERFLDTPVKHYSSGMQMRLAFSVAAHLEPEVLLVDEVLAVGDAAFQRKCLGKMEEVQRGGRTVLFVSHNLAAVERLCTCAVWLERGEMAFMGSAAATIRAYLQRISGDCLHWRRGEAAAKPAYFEEAAIWGEEGGQRAPLTTSTALVVETTVTLTRDMPSLELSVDLLDGVEQILAVSVPADGGVGMPRRAGRYRLTLRFPSGLLLERRYGLRINLYLPTMGAVDRVDTLWFTVAAAASAATAPPLRREGHLFVPCQWECAEAEHGIGPEAGTAGS